MVFLKKMAVFLFFVPVLANAQQKKISNSQMAYADAIGKHFKSYRSALKDSIFILQTEIVTDDLPPFIGKNKIKLLEEKDFEIYAEKDGNFLAFKVFPIEIENKFCKIRIINYLIFKEKGEWLFKFTGGTQSIYKYNCDKGSFIFERQVKISY